MAKIVCFGEIMLRLSPEGCYRLLQADRFNVVYGGCEANVAAALANLGVPVAYVTKLPAHEMVRQRSTPCVPLASIPPAVRGGDRIGVY